MMLECLSVIDEALGSICSHVESMVTFAYNLSAQGVKVGGSEAQGYPVVLDY